MSVTLSRKLIDYVKLAKPKVVSLLDVVAIASYILAFKGNWYNLIPVLIGGSIAAGGSMIINGGLEIEKDKVMKRTSWRPTVKGEVGRKEAYMVGGIACALGSLIGLLANPLTAFFILLGSLVYVFVYSYYLKPRTWLNIVIGGFAGSAAAWAGYAAASNSFNLESLLLGLLVFAWTPGHFWALALRYKRDYANAEIPMLPAIVDDKTAARAIAISNILMIPFALGLMLYLNLIYVIITLAATAVLLYFNVRLMRNPTPEESWISYKFSAPYLAIVMIAAVISFIL
ncbi:heme o synthase [Sulfolobus acidocaldarius]|uniref:Protoheme IX farnesyltransferase n=4 Tax=Sulfolobus acidocaldarius TaxID=2285 RepID=COXX_SULAC|nr:heme o synthase [Sulfolobus acidocaldarius]Q4J8E4.1 RecName: Full=Protoheme IX farnesyltransferase; AltName: Full=Heme B farnesyltransferase; AltName: Full=Heme O synthase [Sulfolobus acidocaldarius DSM 639]AAY80946.1 protoheme IX farnesyltransferase [Sulfolobus acidocaldarius DSM 639]AGE71547.1 protoheme IX farnesyltransferase [Sulfolobus acidocaldarius N8]AGE73820.1 protoheme IX farnesyltransferase [Sulfolobus acidocaldarius Ron12/I]ALU30226.1 protoheme IX farnesyltransferase [Sulfolobus 